MKNTRPDPSRPAERRHEGDEVVALLASHRNVLAWVNGHIHQNRITPHSAPDGRSFAGALSGSPPEGEDAAAVPSELPADPAAE